jgi:hypothetical protein
MWVPKPACLPDGLQYFVRLIDLASEPILVGLGAMVVDPSWLQGSDLLEVAPEVAVFGCGLGDPQDAAAFQAVFVEQSHDVPVAAGLPGVDPRALAAVAPFSDRDGKLRDSEQFHVRTASDRTD